MFLGAGTSLAAPSCIPAFNAMRDAILKGLGWESEGKGTYRHPDPIGGQDFPKLLSSRLLARDAPPEVVFGTLHRFGIPFASHIERLLLEPRPAFNAVHVVAAAVLADGGPVWTPNIDVAIEDAYAELTGAEAERVIVGERDARGQRIAFTPERVIDGVLFKMHGSADAKGSLAFADLELLAPYSVEEITELAPRARDRRLVFYGYRGLDTDLRALIEACIEEASDVVWYELNQQNRREIAAAFGSKVRFDPENLPSPDDRDWRANLAATAERFVAEAAAAGLARFDPQLRTDLGAVLDPRNPEFKFEPEPPAIVQARLVERFGKHEEEKKALRAARRADLFRWPPRAVGDHVHWLISSSLYSPHGLVGVTVKVAAQNPTLAVRLPNPFRSFVFDKGTAVLLRRGNYRALYALTDRASSLPERSHQLKHGADLYYRAHALRYMNSPELARADLAKAAADLVDRSGRSDVERLAGVILEQGINAISQARIADAFHAADALVNGPGRYAIGRWSGWGHWLSAMAHLYSCALQGETDRANRLATAQVELEAAAMDFGDSGLGEGMGDVYIGRLLMHRLRIALFPHSSAVPAPVKLSKRQNQDRLLLLADIAIGQGDLAAAQRHVNRVMKSRPSELTAWLARFAKAEIARVQNKGVTQLDGLVSEAESGGAHFLAAQAVLGRDDIAETAVASGSVIAAVGHPRVLWLLT